MYFRDAAADVSLGGGGQFVPCTKFASATVYDVPSVTAHDDDNTQRTLPPPLLLLLGSVSYSDTFIDSAITACHTGLLAHLSVSPV